MKKKAKEFIVCSPEKIIRKYGYEYHLVECGDRGENAIANACAFGFKGWVLKSCNKIKQ